MGHEYQSPLADPARGRHRLWREPYDDPAGREAGELPGPVLDDERGWAVPIEDLLAAGFRLRARTKLAPAPEQAAIPQPAPPAGGLAAADHRALCAPLGAAERARFYPGRRSRAPTDCMRRRV